MKTLSVSLFVLSLTFGCAGSAPNSETRKAAPYDENFDPRAAAKEVQPEEVTPPAAAVRPVPAKAASNPPVARNADIKTNATVPAKPDVKVADAPLIAAAAPVVAAPAPAPAAVIPPRPVVDTPRTVEIPRRENTEAPIYIPPPPARTIPVDEPRVAAPVRTVPVPPPAPVSRQVTIPTGTMIPVRMIDSVDSKTDRVGQTFQASIDEAVSVNGDVVLPKGADVMVKLTQVKQSGAVSGQSQLQLQLDQITVNRKNYPVESNIYQEAGASQTQQTVRNTGVGAGVGALIGALAGGKKGAAIGAGVGGGAGVASAVIFKGDQVRVPTETKLTFRLEAPLEVTITPGAPPARR